MVKNNAVRDINSANSDITAKESEHIFLPVKEQSSNIITCIITKHETQLFEREIEEEAANDVGRKRRYFSSFSIPRDNWHRDILHYHSLDATSFMARIHEQRRRRRVVRHYTLENWATDCHDDDDDPDLWMKMHFKSSLEVSSGRDKLSLMLLPRTWHSARKH